MTLSPSDSGFAILVDPGGVFPFSNPPPGGTLLPGEEEPTSCPGVLTDDLAVGDPMVTPITCGGDSRGMRCRHR